MCRHLYPADHDLVIEEQYLERRQAAALARAVQDEETGGRKTKEAQPKAKTIFHIFDKAVKPGENDVDRNPVVHALALTPPPMLPSGYVPPYSPQSKFYELENRGGQNTPAPSTRNPVLQHLDEVGPD